MNDVCKSALWALISIPIFFLGFYIGRGLVETGSLLLILYIPTFVIWNFLQNPETPEGLVAVAALTAQYLSYFLIIYCSIKLFRIWKTKRMENIVKEQPEEDPTEIWDLFHDGVLINAQENTPRNLLLTIELEYVREEFDQDFKYFLLELHECSLFEYYPSVGDIKSIKDIESILKHDLWMKDVEKKNDQILVYCADGILKIKYKDYSIFLDTGTKVATQDLKIKLDEAVEKAINSRKNAGDK
jgi:hypothetical protein